ncbi:hypothetical protein IVA82_19390 [Bradyrhizobium sp. 142]|nr:hypothetical protein [Bradyrhizobium sp. 142]
MGVPADATNAIPRIQLEATFGKGRNVGTRPDDPLRDRDAEHHLAFAGLLQRRLEGAPAEFVIVDAVYDADRIRKAAADKGVQAVIASNPSRSPKYPARQASLRRSVTSSSAAAAS